MSCFVQKIKRNQRLFSLAAPLPVTWLFVIPLKICTRLRSSLRSNTQSHEHKNTCKHHKRDGISVCLCCLEAEMSSDKEPRSPLFVYVSITATWQQSDSSNKDRWLVGKKKNNNQTESPSLSLGPSVYINILGLFIASTSVLYQLWNFSGQRKVVCKGVYWKCSDLHVKTNIHRPPSFNHCLSVHPSVYKMPKCIEKLLFFKKENTQFPF